jgi:uncharacterized protein (DUF736 family)
MENKYLDSGALFANDRKQNEKAPDWKGDVELSVDVLKKLAVEAKEGKPAKLSIAGWNRAAKNGKTFISLKFSTPYVAQQPAGSAPAKHKDPWE